MFGNNYYQQPGMNPMQTYMNPYQARLDQLQAMQPQQAVQPPRQELIRVNGEDGAKAYPIAPNSMVPLFDGNDDILYVKSADSGGYGSIRKFRMVEIIGGNSAPMQPENFATKEDVSGLESRLAEMEKAIKDLTE